MNTKSAASIKFISIGNIATKILQKTIKSKVANDYADFIAIDKINSEISEFDYMIIPKEIPLEAEKDLPKIIFAKKDELIITLKGVKMAFIVSDNLEAIINVSELIKTQKGTPLGIPLIYSGSKNEMSISKLKQACCMLKIDDQIGSKKEIIDRVSFLLNETVKVLFELVFIPGLINIELEDIQAMFSTPGLIFFGSGIASGEERAKKAGLASIENINNLNELKNNEILTAIVNISGPLDLGLMEVNEAIETIRKKIFIPENQTLFGCVINEETKDLVKISLLLKISI
jgi:hypothetical protein